MTKILFVDDDAIARRNIRTKIDWKSYNWELIYTAKDAVDAVDFMKQNQPDIILSDIKMPIMDGIQMAMVARNYYPDIKYIFISGYKEFEYAKQALKLNAVDYLNKPLETKQLVQVLREAERLSKEAKRNNDILRDKYPFLQRHYLSQLMYQHFREIDAAVFKAFDINLSDGYGIAGYLQICTDENSAGTDRAEKLGRYLSSIYEGSFFISMGVNQIFLIYTCSNVENEASFKVRIEKMEWQAQQYMKKGETLVFHYGTVIRNLNELYVSYESILKKIDMDTNDLLAKVKSYLNQNYFVEDLSLTQIAEYFHVNHCYLTSIFKEKYGINLYDYLIQTRMKKAGELVCSTSKKVYEIAEEVGYKNSRYFSVVFKKYFGCTVLEYRKQHT